MYDGQRTNVSTASLEYRGHAKANLLNHLARQYERSTYDGKNKRRSPSHHAPEAYQCGRANQSWCTRYQRVAAQDCSALSAASHLQGRTPTRGYSSYDHKTGGRCEQELYANINATNTCYDISKAYFHHRAFICSGTKVPAKNLHRLSRDLG